MGTVNRAYLRSPEDVRSWPLDPAARQSLRDYLEALPKDSGGVLQVLNGGGLDFTGADLSGLDLTEAEFSEAQLSGVRMEGADLYGAWLMAATLHGADLTGCRMRKVEGRACDARHAILREVDLERAEFEDADFRGADLSGALFRTGRMLGADLRGADLRGCSFGTSAGPTPLQKARLAGCLLTGATGRVWGPVDIGAQTPDFIDSDDLNQWFASQGAPELEVVYPAP